MRGKVPGLFVIGGTLFSGIGAPELAAPWIDWKWAAETEPFAAAVHRARFPGVRNLGDVRRIDADDLEPVDLLVFGSPCQSFSIAGKRLGLADPRGNLALIALRLVATIRPRWFLFENVPGLLSSDAGRDFGTFLGAVEQCGYGWAYRTLDAQYAGVPQRRRRVFVVGCLGDWRGAAAVLFEPESLRGHPAPRRAEGESVAPTISVGAHGNSGHQYRQKGNEDALIAMCLNGHGGSHGRMDGESETFVTHALSNGGRGVVEDGTGRETPLTLAIRGRGDSHDLEWRDDGTANAILTPNGGRAGIGVGAVAFAQNQRSEVRMSDIAPQLTTGGGKPGEDYPAVMHYQDSQYGAKEYDTAAIRAGRIPEHSMVVEPVAFDPTARQPEWGLGKPLKCAGPETPIIPIQNAERGQDQNGLGIGGEVMFTLDGASQHAIAFAAMAQGGAGWAPPSCPTSENVALPLDATRAQAVAFAQNQRSEVRISHIAPQLTTGGGKPGERYPAVMAFKPGQSEAAGGVFISDEYAPTLQSVNNGSTAVPAVLFDPTARQPEWSLGKPLKCAGPLAVAFTCSEQANGYAWERDQYPTLNGQVPNDSSNIQQGIRQGMSVRRLTPRECERLQGFPDDWTAISYRGKPAADGPRYRTLGNSMAVPVVKWIIERIARQ